MLTAQMFKCKSSMKATAESFNLIMRPIVISAQCLGLFPVLGITERSTSSLKFRWTSLRAIMSLAMLVSSLLIATAELKRVVRTGVNFSNIVNPYFFVNSGIIVGLFIRLGSRWHQFIARVENVERILSQSCYNLRAVHLRRHCWIAAVTWLALGTLEHFLATTVHIHGQHLEAIRCNWSYASPIENYARRNYAYVFNLPWIPYNIPVLLYLRYVTYSVTLAWTYQDILLILVGIYLTTRYKQLFNRIEAACSVDHPPPPESFWEEIRQHYLVLTEFLQYVNQMLSTMIISSCSNNIFLICYIILHSLKQQTDTISFLYSWFAVCFFSGRTLTTMLTTAKLNQTTRNVLQVVHRIPNEGWCNELQRYYQQLSFEIIALSGKRFFYLTRKSAFGMFALIFTIEIVMIKYSKLAKDAGVPPSCSTLAFSQD